MRKYFVLILFTLIVISNQLKLRVHPVNSKLQDYSGRYRVIHGVNVIYKEFPFLPTREIFNTNNSLVEKDFNDLKNWGFNSIRLFIAW